MELLKPKEFTIAGTDGEVYTFTLSKFPAGCRATRLPSSVRAAQRGRAAVPSEPRRHCGSSKLPSGCPDRP